ncbi:MAG TPA: hypothetical protein VKB67_01960, partial [Rhizomicrobium sp.]|nr:hypothetical protein [Rhizomicrobium sp.]
IEPTAVQTQSFTQNAPAGPSAQPGAQPSDTTAAPPDTTAPATQPGTAPSAGPGISTTQNVADALSGGADSSTFPTAGGSAGPSSLAQSLVAPIPPPADGVSSAPIITPEPTFQLEGFDGGAPGNFNFEGGLFGNQGLPGGSTSMPGGVPIIPLLAADGAGFPDGEPPVTAGNFNPQEGLFAAINNAVDTGPPAGNINPNQGII